MNANIPPVDDAADNDVKDSDTVHDEIDKGGQADLGLGHIDPEKKHGWDVEDFKNSATLRIVVACLAVMTVSAFVEHFCPMLRGNDPLADLFDAFKLIATTALGFLFGRNSK